MNRIAPIYYEFFAGGGMARAGLGDGWQCVFANDFSKMKAAAYIQNWGSNHFIFGDVAKIRPADMPGVADLAWASFPCQDLSLAGDYRGLGQAQANVQTRSGTFWPFWALIKALKAEDRPPRLIVLENVYGALTSRGGEDFSAICSALSDADYRFGAVVIDARLFVPQSRPRVFFIAVAQNLRVPATLISDAPDARWHPQTLIKSQTGISAQARKNWHWWRLETPEARKHDFADLIEDEPKGVAWHSSTQTKYLLGLMSPLNKAKVEAARKLGRKIVGGVYRRTRLDENGAKCQRAEVRFDNVSGCLRTPAGGSSRQTILVIDRDKIRSRLLSPREAARLMGLDDSYRLPERYNDAYHIAGDGVCAPLVRHLAANFLEPVLAANARSGELLAAE
ncbi:DNA-cytosine methyltransferase [Methylocella silvestris BL2]|uniref:DNA (cytosine-5-)-methyltransferase n=1 Tax=Methylocella silvestris (strain DSM 15510 / CIP 108128 / LMG 27833 / NCIMB 13906 / BL2) TaxID=395965 RepID=B8ERB8_METSB|nr:DNA (cytosine-5-)-methyltransferase [Methylocella silvestris]ACK50302.1 DNA-cytosine methyltransferase [Methylocella silvestris BL2]